MFPTQMWAARGWEIIGHLWRKKWWEENLQEESWSVEEKQKVENPKSNTLLFESFMSSDCTKQLDAMNV